MNIAKFVKCRRGQNTIEYLLMLTVIVGVVLIVGAAMKKFMPGFFDSIVQKINGAVMTLGGNGPGIDG